MDDSRDVFINRLRRWEAPVAFVKDHDSAHKSVGITNKVFDRSLMAYQPLLVGKLVGVLKALQARAESNRHAAAIHADTLLDRHGSPFN